MKKLKYLLTAVIITLALLFTACGGLGGKEEETEKPLDPTKLSLRIANYDGGFGSKWLDKVIERFEEQYKDKQFANNKKGVQVVPINGKINFASTIASTSFDIVISQGVAYFDMSASGDLLPITDIVSEQKLPGEDKTIADKMTELQRTALTAVGTNDYYLVPHYEFFGGLAYDINVFEANNLYFAADKNNGNGGFVFSKNDARSNGPDGKPNTSDDGLPSSYEEFFKLLNHMTSETDVTPFVWSGEYKDYMNYLLMGLFSAYTGATDVSYNVTFDSNGKTTKIVTGFNGNEPIIEDKVITPSTGHLLSQQAGKYYALSFLEKILSDSDNYHERVEVTSLTHTGAQKLFLDGYCRNEPIAFLVDGNYWYNEAKDQGLFDGLLQYGYTEKDRKFGWMPLPSRILDSDPISENKTALVNMTDTYMMINANIKDNAEKVEMAKAFVQLCNTDESLREFTRITGATKALQYELTDEDIESLDSYSQTFLARRKESDVVYPMSNNNLFINNQSAFTTNIGGDFWRATLSNGSSSFKPLELMMGGAVKAKDYFQGMKISSQTWTSKYGKWF